MQAQGASQFRFVALFSHGIDLLDLASHDNVSERLVDVGELTIGQLLTNAEHQVVIDVAHAVIDAIEIQRVLDGVFDFVGDVIERQVFGADER